MKKVYSNDKISVFWDSDKCIHSGNCFSNLPEVFKPMRRPWVIIDAAEAEAIRETVAKCPSGALTCKMTR
jgi:uncharacterized Fe-S cluster protein YjdI